VKKTRRKTKRKEKVDLSRPRPVCGHGYMKECRWLFLFFSFYVERKETESIAMK
jgi:hypothetical protein